MKNETLRPLFPVIILFITLNGAFTGGRILLEKWSLNNGVLIMGNLILFIVTLISFFIGRKGLQSGNAQHFVRSVYLSFILKFFILLAAAFAYIMIAKKEVSKASLITCMCLYLVYTFFEVSILMKMAKQKKNE